MGSPMGRLHLGGAPAETALPNAASRATARAHEHATVANGASPGATCVAEEVAFSGVTHVAEDGAIKYFPANQLGDESQSPSDGAVFMTKIEKKKWQVAHYDDGG